ncbi:hypothetical protein K0M31_001339 [Melipona bicolor]|uniref:Uncharacterized protein n=1 Tax=Melipona bicolor TaxID=60889 RepID=A0AA40KXQ9_9HYME|nr:hypothetical protein K0M31_001339 [Melipona bicolor]
MDPKTTAHAGWKSKAGKQKVSVCSHAFRGRGGFRRRSAGPDGESKSVIHTGWRKEEVRRNGGRRKRPPASQWGKAQGEGGIVGGSSKTQRKTERDEGVEARMRPTSPDSHFSQPPPPFTIFCLPWSRILLLIATRWEWWRSTDNKRIEMSIEHLAESWYWDFTSGESFDRDFNFGFLTVSVLCNIISQTSWEN